MTFEVELKFPLPDAREVLARLAALGVVAGAAVEQQDLYFAHPQRDFGQTDEAFRIRSVGDSNCVTYKGPVIDSRTKTRRELEIGFEAGADAARNFAVMLEMLGFRQVRAVHKRRTPHRLQWSGRACEVALDEVEQLGSYVEIEMLAEEAEREAARDAILALAHHLGLADSERKSYLCLLLEKQLEEQPVGN